MKFGQKILLFILINNNEVEIKIPIDEEIEFYKECIGETYLHCCNVWGALDELKVTIQNRVMNPFKTGSTIVGAMSIMSVVCLYSLQMGKLGQPFTMHLEYSMILQW